MLGQQLLCERLRADSGSQLIGLLPIISFKYYEIRKKREKEERMKAKKIIAAGLTATMVLGLATGCGGGGGSTAKNSAGEDIVTLKWVSLGSGMPDNYDSWIQKVNDYLGEKIGVNLDIEIVGYGDWDNRRNVIISTNEAYDIIFGTTVNYVSDIKLGAYYDITDLKDEYMADLNEMMPEEYWEAVTVDGKIYGVPTYKDSSISNYAVWDKSIVDEYNLDISQLTELDSLTPVFEQLKADKNDYPVYVKNDGVYYIFDVYDRIGAGTQILGVRYDDPDARVCFTLEEDDIYSELETLHEWYQKGIINPDASTLSEARTYNMWRVAQGWESAGKTSWGPAMGCDVEVQKVGDTILSNDTVQGSINMISANTKYPEKCLETLNLLNSDSTLRDMFYYGEEGVNFEYTDDGKVHKLNQDWSWAGYIQATFFVVTPEDTDIYDQWDEIKALNEQAVPAVTLGFTLDTTEIADKLSNCNEIWLRYRSEVMTGVQDPAVAVPEIKEELMNAGFQDVLDEAQRQVDEFMASK